jgi:very-short-patch-repair endonuclease
LRSSRLGGHKFRRQHPVPPYVLDFYCETARVAVELDGSQHSVEADAQRTTFLNAAGVEVLRFWDNDVLGNTALVLESILSSIQSRTLTPSPSPGGRGEQSEHSIL